jgi:DNA-binding transcriptional MocR family regulator
MLRLDTASPTPQVVEIVQGLDLLARFLVKPGDAVLVDEHGSPDIHYILHSLGASLVPVPRTPQGYDMDALEAATHSILLGPGHLFYSEPRQTGWLRFNVAFSEDERLWDFLAGVIREQGGE